MISETVEDNTKPRISVHVAHHCEANNGVRKCRVISVSSYRQNTTMSLHCFPPLLQAKNQNWNDAKENSSSTCDP